MSAFPLRPLVGLTPLPLVGLSVGGVDGVDGGDIFGLGRRKLMPSFEHVTANELTVTSSISAISSRDMPRSTRLRICWIRSGVNLSGRPFLPSSPAAAEISVIAVRRRMAHCRPVRPSCR
jgi:hypothetical protein